MSASGGCEEAVTRTMLGWVESKEFGEILFGFSLETKGTQN